MDPITEPEAQKKLKTESALDHLKAISKVVADSGDFNEIAKYQPEDSTTNPSLLLQVASKPEFSYIMENSIKYGLDHFNRHCSSKKKAKPKKGKNKEEPAEVAVVYKELSA